MDVISQAKTLFDDWGQTGRGDRMAEGHWPRVSQFIDGMAITPGITCLDVGCGNGYAVREMARRTGETGRVIGVDVSPVMVALAKEQTNQPNVTLMTAEADRLPLPDGEVDRLLSVEMLYYAPDMAAVANEWRRVVKPDGSAWVMVDYYVENPYSECWGGLLGIPVHYQSETEYQALFEDAGFQNVQTRRIFDPRPVDESNFEPGWGYETPDDVRRFRTEIGSLLIIAG